MTAIGTLRVPASGQRLGPAEVTLRYIDRALAAIAGNDVGTASGRITGRRFDLIVDWHAGPSKGGRSTYTGHVNDDGRASGTVSTRVGDKISERTWRSDALTCVPKSAQIPGSPFGAGPNTPLKTGPDPAPQNKPLDGPSVSWDPVPGGLVVHISDRSGVDSQCTYKADAYERGFFLRAKSTYDLQIVPAIPKYGNWDVTVTCDNGTSTRTSIFF